MSLLSYSSVSSELKVISIHIFSRESDSTFTNVRPSVSWLVSLSPKPPRLSESIIPSYHQPIFSRESDSTITNVCPSVRLSVSLQNPSTAWNPHNPSFILHHSSFILHHPLSFFIHPSFISQLLSFSACLIGYTNFHEFCNTNET